MRRIVLALVIAAIAFAGITLLALEGREVVVVKTTQPDGTIRRTRVWIADDDAGPVIEVGNPDRGFYQDLLRTPAFEIERGGQSIAVTGEMLPNPEGHERVRRLLREKYGWADHWVALIADTSRSMALRIHPR